MNLFKKEMPDERIPELIEPEIIDVAVHKRERKPKAAYEEMFDNLPSRPVQHVWKVYQCKSSALTIELLYSE